MPIYTRGTVQVPRDVLHRVLGQERVEEYGEGHAWDDLPLVVDAVPGIVLVAVASPAPEGHKYYSGHCVRLQNTQTM